jgi:hypothetical protein
MSFLNETFYATRAILMVLAIAVMPIWPAAFLAWLHLHRELILGILIGSVGELLAVYASRWTWDRIQWLRWFSHQ